MAKHWGIECQSRFGDAQSKVPVFLRGSGVAGRVIVNEIEGARLEYKKASKEGGCLEVHERAGSALKNDEWTGARGLTGLSSDRNKPNPLLGREAILIG